MTKSREKGSGIRDQGRGMGDQELRDLDAERMKRLLRSALPPIGNEQEADRDLWPAMLRRFDERSMPRASRVPWFDWALAGGLVAFAAIAPRAIPVILYYL